MPSKVSPANWLPQGIESLEEAAAEAVRYDKHALVIAGPGAGKTELLAQRACYLLQAGLCPRPTRILAISLKRDAAKNLAERVKHRCGEVLARRFDSQTFDAFAKGLVDRFGPALPEKWRPSPDYEINFDIECRYRDRVSAVPAEYQQLNPGELAALAITNYKTHFIGRRISAFPDNPTTPEDRAADGVWQYLLHSGEKSSLNFHMLGRLAEHLLSTNPKILEALRASYGFVFLDEFQDTTSIYYALTKTAFLTSGSVLTAVGDDKQSIMRWALALSGIFATFQADFKARVFALVRNHRSAPKLVQIIGTLAKAIDPHCNPPEPVDDGSGGEGECRILEFPNEIREAEELAQLIEQWALKDGVPPRSICVLTRQTPALYGAALLGVLEEKKIPARIEETLQALLSEPVVALLLDCLKLATRPQAPVSWRDLTSFLSRASGGDDETYGRQIAQSVSAFIDGLRKLTSTAGSSDTDVATIVARVVDFVGRSRLIGEFPQYKQGTFLNDALADFSKHFSGFLAGSNWPTAVDAFEGTDALPLMTIHKSKGLEYHTVVFLGLEDYPFRSFKTLQDEEAASFFVAFSRAKKRVVFTFCRSRNGKAQTAKSIKPLYRLLLDEGVSPEKFE